MTRAAAALALLLLPGLLAFTPTAEAASSTIACSKLVHEVTATAKSTHYRISTDASDASAACTNNSVTLLEGECLTFNVKYVREGATAPPNPTRWIWYWFHGSTNNDHGATGRDNWGGPIQWSSQTADPHGSTETLCGTSDGTSTGTPKAGNYRLVLRTCNDSNPQPTSVCTAATTTVDINNDENPTCACQGAPGAGNTASGTWGAVEALYNPNLRDPLWVGGPSVVHTGETVNITIHSEFDFGDARTGVPTNITLRIWRVTTSGTGTIVLNDTNPTEETFTTGRSPLGNYYLLFTPDLDAHYKVVAFSITSTNTTRSSKPYEFRVTPAPLTLAAFQAWRDAEARPHHATSNGTLSTTSFTAWRDGEARPAWAALNGTLTLGSFAAWRDDEARPMWTTVNGSLPTASFAAWRDGEARPAWITLNGTLSLATFQAWRDGEARPLRGTVNDTLPTASFAAWRDGEARPAWATLNGTAQEQSLTSFRNTTDAALASIHDQTKPAESRWETAWAQVKPQSANLAGLLLVALAFVTLGWLGRSKTLRRQRATLVVLGVALLVVYGRLNTLGPL